MPCYPIRYLLAVPIEYIGGNSLVLLVCLAIVAVGLVTIGAARWGWPSASASSTRSRALILIVWAAVPPALIYAYSFVGEPIFGPSRYHLFSAPAYLMLVRTG